MLCWGGAAAPAVPPTAAAAVNDGDEWLEGKAGGAVVRALQSVEASSKVVVRAAWRRRDFCNDSPAGVSAAAATAADPPELLRLAGSRSCSWALNTKMMAACSSSWFAGGAVLSCSRKLGSPRSWRRAAMAAARVGVSCSRLMRSYMRPASRTMRVATSPGVIPWPGPGGRGGSLAYRARLRSNSSSRFSRAVTNGQETPRERK
mmetsp:Transcript_22528/g.62238  ORF Transcript_22528/g.62238 Transcript_22528/m.62238 type:complete len:204 (-) Transcript_22528:732-1343(-)